MSKVSPAALEETSTPDPAQLVETAPVGDVRQELPAAQGLAAEPNAESIVVFNALHAVVASIALEGKPRRVAWSFNIAIWKRNYLERCFPDFEFRYISFRDTVSRHERKIAESDQCIFVVWGVLQPDDLESYATTHGIQIMRLEDGFIRSQGLGSNHVLPYSLCVDHSGIYFDARRTSDLENLLSTLDFDAESELLTQADECLAIIRRYGITKYNEPRTRLAQKLYGAKTRVRILVLGQVEDDQSILFGCDRKLDNNDVVRIALEENPGAQVIYKVHPDVLIGKRSELSNPNDVADFAIVIRQSMSLDDALTGVDRVYTISSLGGFEALIRGVPVTTLGAPFYSGWGLTDDRQASSRRGRTLQLNQLFAAAYLKYARYFDPPTGRAITLADVLQTLSSAIQTDKHFVDGSLESAARATTPRRHYVYGFPHHASTLKQVMGEDEVVVLDKATTVEAFSKLLNPKSQRADAELYLWNAKLPGLFKGVVRKFQGLQLCAESGFIEQLGVDLDPHCPFFMNVDGVGLSWDTSSETELIKFLNASSDNLAIVQGAVRLKKYLLDRLSLNSRNTDDGKLQARLGPKKKTRILVLGHAEENPESQQAGCKHYSSNDLVVIAKTENPDAQVIYRPHSSNESGSLKYSDPAAVSDLCVQVPSSCPVSVLLEECDHVYAVSHIGGFEALLRGKAVTLLGAPFYSGWGLTDDRQPVPYRTRTLTIDELFAGSCLLFPRLIDPVYKKRIPAEEAANYWISADQRLNRKSLDADDGRELRVGGKLAALIPTYVIGFSPWKQFIVPWFPERQITFIDKRMKAADFLKDFATKISSDSRSEIFVWGFKMEPYLQKFIETNNVRCCFVEDGFIRSVSLGATKAPPYSLNLDSKTPYFDATRPSDLERLLSEYDFVGDPALLLRADALMDKLLKTGLSKYNNSKAVDVNELYGEKQAHRILVVGQVEDDASIEFGCEKRYTNNDIVLIAALENPGAHIIYKPHPDVLNGHRPKQSNPDDVRHVCQVLDVDIPLSQAFETIDHVYTITSQAGFEALIRGIKVTTLGCPFYAGWGLTDERQPNPRRNRKLSVREVFAAAYLLYPRYFDPIYKQPISAEEAVDRLVKMREMSFSAASKKALVGGQTGVAEIRQKYLFGFPHSASILKQVMGGDDVTVIDRAATPEMLSKLINAKDQRTDAELYLWNGAVPAPFRATVKKFKGRQRVAESGFIEQLGAVAGTYCPFFLNIDGAGSSYETGAETDLVKSLNAFTDDADVMLGAAHMKTYLLERLSRNRRGADDGKLRSILGFKDQCRILVIGHLEDGAESNQSGRMHYTGNDLVVIAKTENPDAQVIYRPHSSNESGSLKYSDPAAVSDLCVQVPSSCPVSVLLEECDHVYAVSHIGGFEALLRGKAVTLLGAPFYSGWGLTDDRQPVPYRTRTLTIDELFAGSCLLFPRLIDPVYKKRIPAEEAANYWISADQRLNRKTQGVDARAALRASAKPGSLIPTYVIGFSPWKQFIGHWFPERQMTFIDKKMKAPDFLRDYGEKIISDPRSEFFVWGFKMEPFMQEFIETNNIRSYFVEDGFIRSVSLGATKAPPYSLNLDSKTPYFDATRPSDLERLLSEYDFVGDPALLLRADALMDKLLKTGLSKYNNSKAVDVNELYGEKQAHRILVVGQVEDDASIEFGCEKRYTNNDIVLIAALENPGAHIIYKPHPDVLNGHRPKQSNPDDVRHVCQVLDVDIPLSQAFETIDHVYTITSQAGFEALIRGIKVTTLGCPFYAGWGLTDERQPNPRRNRKLSVREVFAAAYLLYPRYFDPIYKQPISAEEAVDRLVKMREMSSIARQASDAASADALAESILAAESTAGAANVAGEPGAGLGLSMINGEKMVSQQAFLEMLSNVQLSLIKMHNSFLATGGDSSAEQRDPAN